jgi:hypothetical protein
MASQMNLVVNTSSRNLHLAGNGNVKRGVQGSRQGMPLSKVNGLSTKRKDFAFDWCWLFGGLALMGFS